MARIRVKFVPFVPFVVPYFDLLDGGATAFQFACRALIEAAGGFTSANAAVRQRRRFWMAAASTASEAAIGAAEN